tara:strand:- start:897 stop:1439 length:543 start_codon:yes stop_codon:yes gene_type:complete
MDDFINMITSTYASLGGATVVLVALSAWLGKVWAARILQKEISKHSENIAKLQVELDSLKQKDIARHNYKLATYRTAVSLICELLSEFESVTLEKKSSISSEVEKNFSINRNMIYGNIALVSSQNVMNKYNDIIDYFIPIIYEEEPLLWEDMRSKVDILLNEMRTDLEITDGQVVYQGVR